MKKIAFLFVIMLAFTSCNDDDVDFSMEEEETALLEGRWNLTAFRTENEYDLNEDGTASNDLIAETGCYMEDFLQFINISTIVFTSRSFANIELDIVTGTTDEYEYTITCESQTELTNATFTADGDTLEILVEGQTPVEGTINGTTLTIVIPDSFPIEVEEGDGTATLTEDVTFVYTKQE